MSLQQQSRGGKTLNPNLPSQLLLVAQLTFCLGISLMQLQMMTVSAAELPAELMLEGVSLIKSMEYAKEKQQQQTKQKHHHQQSQHKSHLLHELAKRFAFNSNNNNKNAVSAEVDIDGMQASALSPGDIARFERELFLQSALDDDDVAVDDIEDVDASLPIEDVELPLAPNSMEHTDLMERTIDYKQHQTSAPMWLQQHSSSDGVGGGNNDGVKGKIASSNFVKIQQPYQKQQQQHHHLPHNQQKQHQRQSHRLNGDGTAANSVTLAPPPAPVAEPKRRCAIEISTKLTGVCQTMSPIGPTCVAGDYMDAYNQDCL